MDKKSTARQAVPGGVGARIREVRVAMGATQTSFAKSLGVSQNYLSAVETEKANPNMDIFVGLARGFPFFDLRWILSGEGKMYVAHAVVLGASDDEAMCVALRIAWPRFQERAKAQKNLPWRAKRGAWGDSSSPFRWLAKYVLLLYERFLVAYRELRQAGTPDQVARLSAAERCEQYAAELEAITGGKLPD